jgi:hypothetical protein
VAGTHHTSNDQLLLHRVHTGLARLSAHLSSMHQLFDSKDVDAPFSYRRLQQSAGELRESNAAGPLPKEKDHIKYEHRRWRRDDCERDVKNAVLQLFARMQSTDCVVASLPTAFCCNNPTCGNLATASESFRLVRGAACVCGACLQGGAASGQAAPVMVARWVHHACCSGVGLCSALTMWCAWRGLADTPNCHLREAQTGRVFVLAWLLHCCECHQRIHPAPQPNPPTPPTLQLLSSVGRVG